jgi:hypothetical protein
MPDELERMWEAIKQRGSTHYKTGRIEPIDLYRSAGLLKPFCVCNIIKYAYRQQADINPADCDKIAHYNDMLRFAAMETEMGSKP